ncbi:hypothetical protein DFH09DRAFT_1287554 [Mycena vulgaris]|nr:hypothetical protein DFH09DRAFT_1287554 [Mycena vulgaris]
MTRRERDSRLGKLGLGDDDGKGGEFFIPRDGMLQARRRLDSYPVSFPCIALPSPPLSIRVPLLGQYHLTQFRLGRTAVGGINFYACSQFPFGAPHLVVRESCNEYRLTGAVLVLLEIKTQIFVQFLFVSPRAELLADSEIIMGTNPSRNQNRSKVNLEHANGLSQDDDSEEDEDISKLRYPLCRVSSERDGPFAQAPNSSNLNDDDLSGIKSAVRIISVYLDSSLARGDFPPLDTGELEPSRSWKIIMGVQFTLILSLFIFYLYDSMHSHLSSL